MNPMHWIGLIAMAVGGLCVLWTGRSALRRWWLLRDGVKTKGKVLRVEKRDIGDESTCFVYTPTVGYKANDGRTRERTLPASDDPKRFKVGKNVPILYQRNDPDHVCEVGARWTDWLFGLAMSFALVAFGALLFFCFVPDPGTTRDRPAPQSPKPSGNARQVGAIRAASVWLLMKSR